MTSWRGRGLNAVVVVDLAASCMGFVLGCSHDLDSGGGGSTSSSGMSGAETACSAPSDCPDPGSECLSRTCASGKCGTAAVPTGTPVGTQTPGDCKVVQCNGAGATETVNDDTDVPDDDKACTDDLCMAGLPWNSPKAVGEPCGNGLVCDGTGQCTGCAAVGDCPGQDTECKTRTCDAHGVCGFSFTPAGTPTSTQTPGDCKENRCDGAGHVISANHDADKPIDGKACTDDVCMAGAPSNPPTMAGMPCNQSGGIVCDGKSACVACIMATTCSGQDTACKVRSCVAGTCGFENLPAGTPTVIQTPGDCKVNQCDGNGSVAVANDDNDVPNDNKPCTYDLCNAGVPSHTLVLAGTPCGVNLVCDVNGNCVGCVTPGSCPGQDTECKTRTCTMGACGFSFTPAGTPVAMQTPGDCKVSQCNGAGSIVVAPDDTDMPVDGNACTKDVCTAGVPSNPPAMAGAACAQMGGKLCNGAGVCVACLAASDCPGQDTDCQTRTCVMGACGVVNAPSGTPTSMQTAGDCLENECNGMGAAMSVPKDADVPVDGNQCTGDVCTAGVPSNPPVMASAACNQNGGVVCDGMGACVQCLSGAMCPSGVCTAHVCQAATCTDGMKNGAETDIDCGGPCPTKCGLGKGCAVNGDCIGQLCEASVCSQINGCDATNTIDLTGMGATTVLFGAGAGNQYVPRCIKVKQGTDVTFSGDFVAYPTVGGEVVNNMLVPAASGPFVPETNMGTMKVFPMSKMGTFPYYCAPHAIADGMAGAVFVVP